MIAASLPVVACRQPIIQDVGAVSCPTGVRYDVPVFRAGRSPLEIPGLTSVSLTPKMLSTTNH